MDLWRGQGDLHGPTSSLLGNGLPLVNDLTTYDLERTM